MTNPIVRTPYARKIRYGITGAPVLTADEMQGSHAPGVGLAPRLIELIYSAAREGKPAAVAAAVTGEWTVSGRPADGEITTYFGGDPSGWPAWLAEEVRLAEAEAALAPLEAAVRADRRAQQTGDRAALRDRIAAAIREADTYAQLERRDDRERFADAVLAVLSEPTDQAVGVNCTCFVVNDGGVHAASCAKRATDQAAVRAALREAADWYAQQGKTVLAASQVAADLHRRAGGDAPLSPYYEHPECGFHWHGRDGMDIPIRDGQPVCPRCELAKVQKRLDYTQRMREEVGTECKRRGKRMLEQAEQIRTLEQQLDEVRRQLGEEILRAGQAEDENARLRTGQAAVRAAALSESERTMLRYALDQAQEAIWSQGGFTEEDQAAVDSLRRLADEAQGTTCPGFETGPNRCGCPCEGCKHNCAAHEPAGPAAPAKDTPDGCTCAVAGDAFAPAGHYADCPAAPAKEA